jgi:hypothetical protein
MEFQVLKMRAAKNTKQLTALLLLAGLLSCRKDVTLDLPEYQQKVVVEVLLKPVRRPSSSFPGLSPISAISIIPLPRRPSSRAPL